MANQPNFVSKGATLKIVNTLPDIGEAENGELFFLISDSKIYLRVTAGFIATAALS